MADRSDLDMLVLLHAAERAFDAAEARPPEGEAMARRVFDALHSGDLRPVCAAGGGQRLPACTYLDVAIESARDHGGPVGEVARALRAVAPELEWERRLGVEDQPVEFAQGHANAILARSNDPELEVIVGVSLMAPAVLYPDHHHPPEEVYIVSSPGEWRQNQDAWHEPGTGAIVHNPAGIVHAMRSGDAPLLALWLHVHPRAGV